MKSFLTIFFSRSPPAARLNRPTLRRSVRRCLPDGSTFDLNAIVRVESGGNQNAMDIDFPKIFA